MQKVPEKFIVGFDEAGGAQIPGPVNGAAVILRKNLPVEI